MNWYVDYNQIAPSYDSRYERNEYSGVERALKQFVGNDSEIQILEIGCGTGHWLGILRTWGLQAIGLDFSLQMLARAKASLPDLTLIHGRAECLPWPTESFDRVFCINAFHHFADKRAFLAEARRILRPGGMMLSVGLDPHRGIDRWYVYDYFKESLEIDRLREDSDFAT